MIMKMDGFQQVLAVGRFMSMQEDVQGIIKNKQNSSCSSLRSMLVML